MASSREEVTSTSEKVADSKGEVTSPPSAIKFSLNIGEKRKAESPLRKPMMPVKLAGKSSTGISMKIATKSSDSKTQKIETKIVPKKGAVAQAFNDDESDEEEEMPKEAKMRMRNIGKNTPTSAGPNSFNKGKEGFTDHKKVWEKTMKLEPTEVQRKPVEKDEQ